MAGTSRLVLRELAQCPPEDLAAFRDVDRHRYFNTNNLWIRLEDLRDELDHHESLLDLRKHRARPLNASSMIVGSCSDVKRRRSRASRSSRPP
jgi:hypothetical protein